MTRLGLLVEKTFKPIVWLEGDNFERDQANADQWKH